MTSNHLYNLMRQLVEEDTSLHRIKNNYLKDSTDCPECQELWQAMVKDKEEHVEKFTALIQQHMGAGA